MTNTRKHREMVFHDKRFADDDHPREAATKYYSIRQKAQSFYRNLVLFHSKGKRLLDYGCGTGRDSIFWAKSGAIVTGIDISNQAIKKARENAVKEGVTVDYFVMDAEDLQFEGSSFDIVAGTAILHHLDLRASYSELSRVLKRTGHGIFIEPMGHNPLINLYRRYTPTMRTVDEHPLLMADIQVAKDYFDNVDTRFFNLFTLLAVPLRNTRTGFDILLGFLNRIDSIAFSGIPFIGRYAWTLVLHLSNAKKISNNLLEPAR